jgi:hypothetical protein
MVEQHVLPPEWVDWTRATVSTGLSHQTGYAAVCAWHGTKHQVPKVRGGLCVDRNCFLDYHMKPEL